MAFPNEHILILETSSKNGEVALARAGQIVGVRSLPEARRHARDLTARTAELLSDLGWHARDLSAVIVGIGPGSYTGLRVGIASAKALAFAIGMPLFGVPTFDGIAAGVEPMNVPLELIADAQQGQVYCQRFTCDQSGRWVSSGSIEIRSYEHWASDLRPGSVIAGPAAAPNSQRIPGEVQLASEATREPQIRGLLRACEYDAERYRVNPWELEPIYLRGSSAEEKRKLAIGTDIASNPTT